MTNPIQRLREAHEAATPDHWWLFDEPSETRGVYGPDGDELATVQGNLALGGDALDNAHAIVLAHNALPALLDIAEAAQRYIDWQYRQPGARRFTMTDLRAALDRLEEVGS
jgi:hypothetical protein